MPTLELDAKQHGPPLIEAACRRAAILPGCHASTRGSFMPAVSSTAGYAVASFTRWYEDITRSAASPSGVAVVPNSGALAGPLAETSKRSMSMTGTRPTMAA